MWSSSPREGFVHLATRVPKSLHTRIRVDAVERETTVSQWITDALAAYLKRTAYGKREKPRAAASSKATR